MESMVHSPSMGDAGSTSSTVPILLWGVPDDNYSIVGPKTLF